MKPFWLYIYIYIYVYIIRDNIGANSYNLSTLGYTSILIDGLLHCWNWNSIFAGRSPKCPGMSKSQELPYERGRLSHQKYYCRLVVGGRIILIYIHMHCQAYKRDSDSLYFHRIALDLSQHFRREGLGYGPDESPVGFSKSPGWDDQVMCNWTLVRSHELGMQQISRTCCFSIFGTQNTDLP